MSYFSVGDHQALTSTQAQSLNGDVALQRVYNKLLDLHKAVYTKMRNHKLFVHPCSRQSSLVSFESASSRSAAETMTLPYFRSGSEAELVERLMGRQHLDCTGEARFHPVIELRLSPEYFAVELVVSPDAWWDQQNLLGKLASKRHRAVFARLLAEMGAEYRLGFWGGVHLSDMHLTTGQLTPRALHEWMDTFEAGQDWFRLGHWYAPEDPALNADSAVQEVFRRVEALYSPYSFLLWTSNNNFRHLHQRRRTLAFSA